MMKSHHCATKNGEHFILWQNDDGLFCCPVCGSPELKDAPYYDNVGASFQMCSCGFEYGYDDSPLATKTAVQGIEANWDRWRLGLINEAKLSKNDLEALIQSLRNIGIELAYDLIPIKKTTQPNTEAD
jgi:hypothetical protein